MNGALLLHFASFLITIGTITKNVIVGLKKEERLDQKKLRDIWHKSSKEKPESLLIHTLGRYV